jgi:hypothetical protein
VPPKPAKPPALKKASSQPAAPSNDASLAEHLRPNGSSDDLDAIPPSIASLQALLQPGLQTNDTASGPPPIPFASRPAAISGTSSIPSQLLARPLSPARKRSKSPPPVPSARRITRSPSPTIAIKSTGTSERTDAVRDFDERSETLLGVAGLASKFGGQSPGRPASPSSLSFSQGITPANPSVEGLNSGALIDRKLYLRQGERHPDFM